MREILAPLTGIRSPFGRPRRRTDDADYVVSGYVIPDYVEETP